MKKAISLLVVLTIFLAAPVLAEQPSKEQLLRFIEAMEMRNQFEEQLIGLRNQGDQTAQQYAQKVLTSVPDLPPEFAEYMELEYQNYRAALSEYLDVDFAINSYIELISKKLTSEDVSKLTEFHESELGRKFTRANTEVMGDWAKSFMNNFESKMMLSLQTFVNNLMTKASSYQQTN